jgi:hypothetical protein
VIQQSLLEHFKQKKNIATLKRCGGSPVYSGICKVSFFLSYSHMMYNIFLVVVDVPINSEMFLMIDFVNLNIKMTRSFECVHKYRLHVCVFI